MFTIVNALQCGYETRNSPHLAYAMISISHLLTTESILYEEAFICTLTYQKHVEVLTTQERHELMGAGITLTDHFVNARTHDLTSISTYARWVSAVMKGGCVMSCYYMGV